MNQFSENRNVLTSFEWHTKERYHETWQKRVQTRAYCVDWSLLIYVDR